MRIELLASVNMCTIVSCVASVLFEHELHVFNNCGVQALLAESTGMDQTNPNPKPESGLTCQKGES